MVDKKTGAIDRIAIDHIVKLRDWLVVERLRLFRLKRAIDAYARTVDSELLRCVEAGRELGAKIALPIWENVWKTSLQEEMRRVCAVSEWTRPEQAMKKSAYGPLSFDDVLASRVGDALRDCEHQESLARQEGWRARRPTLRQLVLDQLQIGWSRRLESRPDPNPRQTDSGTRLSCQGCGDDLKPLGQAGAGAPERPRLVPYWAKLRGGGRPGGRANTRIVA